MSLNSMTIRSVKDLFWSSGLSELVIGQSYSSKSSFKLLQDVDSKVRISAAQWTGTVQHESQL